MADRLARVADLPVVTPSSSSFWHVTLSVAGDGVDPPELRAGLERLSEERPFLLAARYTADRAEIRYWEEASCLDDAAALALRLWGEHRRSAALPAWRVTGLEVLDRETFQWRAGREKRSPLGPAGGVRPF